MTGIPSSKFTAADANRKFYEECRPGQDDYWKYMAAPYHRRKVFFRIIAKHQPSSIMDIGCGDGRLIAEVNRRFPTIQTSGTDLASNQISRNQERMPGSDWFCADVNQSTVEWDSARNKQYDLVIASELIEHLDNPETFLQNLSGLLAGNPSSTLVLSTQSGPLRETEQRVGHHRHFSRAEMAEMLSSAGWEPIKVWNEGYPFHDLSKWYANLDPDASMGRFGRNSYGVIERFACFLLRSAFYLNSSSSGAQLFAIARIQGTQQGV